MNRQLPWLYALIGLLIAAGVTMLAAVFFFAKEMR
jgi:hypothetical protein